MHPAHVFARGIVSRPPRMPRLNLGRWRVAAVLLASFFIAPSALASQTSGTISSTDKYAWSNVGGWVNFAPSSSSVSVTDSGLSGYAWSANTGWINLAPSQGGVKNDGNGTLSGFAWDESEGWISFTGVTIDRSGVFHGIATGANESITFDCANCRVQTDWRHYDTRFGLEGGGGSVSYGAPVAQISSASHQSEPPPAETAASSSLETQTAPAISPAHVQEPETAQFDNGSTARTQSAGATAAFAPYQPATKNSVSPLPTLNATATSRATPTRAASPAPLGVKAITAIGGGLLLLIVLAFFAF